jgi:hypothetical protein
VEKINLIWTVILMVFVVIAYLLALWPPIWGYFLVYRDHIRLFADATLSLLIAAAAALLIYLIFAGYRLAFRKIAQTAGYSKEDQIKAVRSAFRMLGFWGLLSAGASQLPILIYPP